MEAFPSSTDEVTPALLTQALRSTGTIGADTAVAEVHHETIGEGVGIMGQLARLTVRYAGPATGAPGSMVVKLPSHLPENRAVGEHFRFYEREGRFYEQIGGKVEVRTARCYWNHVDPATATYGLLLEDLGGRTMISQIAGLGAGRAEQALCELAKLHAEWWASPALDGLTWMPRLDDPVNLAAGQQYRDAWPLFVERIGDAVPAEAIALGERVKEQYESLLVVGVADAPLTICHGDFRADNLMFDDAPDAEDAIAVLDWQISFRGPAISDVTYLLCQSMTVEERRESEQALVRAWHDALLDGDVPGGSYPFDLAWEHHQRGMLGATVYPVTAMGALDPANDRGRELVEQMAVRAFTAALDHDAARFLA